MGHWEYDDDGDFWMEYTPLNDVYGDEPTPPPKKKKTERNDMEPTTFNIVVGLIIVFLIAIGLPACVACSACHI